MKTCNKCGIEKEDSEFRKGRNQCKSCTAAYNKTYKKANKERICEQDKTYKKANKERRREHNKTYYQVNKESDAARNKAYHKANPINARVTRLRRGTLKGMPDSLIEVQALNNLIKHTLKQMENNHE